MRYIIILNTHKNKEHEKKSNCNCKSNHINTISK